MATERWQGPDGDLGRFVTSESQKTLDSYSAQPKLVVEHANLERDTAHGGYQHRQVYELVQNAADALWTEQLPTLSGAPPVDARPRRGRIETRLTNRCLYCADDGDSLDEPGMTALMFSHMSPKRVTRQIGTFGLGFKAVLGVSDAPEFYSRSGSFRFQRSRSSEQIRAIVPNDEPLADFPVLRLPEPIEPSVGIESDPVLGELMEWASNIVRLPLRQRAFGDLEQQLADFPAEFILFVPHVESLTFTVDGGPLRRQIRLDRDGDDLVLDDGTTTARWRVFERLHRLSDEARADQRSGDEANEIPIWWAAPIDRLQRHDRFWSHFPTETSCLVSGILNAPWKTNEDRQNLLTGDYNDELVRAAAAMVADALPSLSDNDDPARHLDVLPRRREPGDNHHADLLRDELNDELCGRPVVPDQEGTLQTIDAVHYLPRVLERSASQNRDALQRWATSASRPIDWLHRSVYRGERFSAVGRLFEAADEFVDQQPLVVWLEALVHDADADQAVSASAAAIQTAALLPIDIRQGIEVSRIVYSMEGEWLPLDPERVFLVDAAPAIGDGLKPRISVHAGLMADDATLAALKELDFVQPSAESEFNLIADSVLDWRYIPDPDASVDAGLWFRFWELSRRISVDAACDIISDYNDFKRAVLVRTHSGSWRSVCDVLIPGVVVPDDGSRDGEVAVDLDFHHADRGLLEWFGVTDKAHDVDDLANDPAFRTYERDCEEQYRQQRLPRNPQSGMLGFSRSEGAGPLSVFRRLSDDGRVLYTSSLMDLDSTFEHYDYGHQGTNGHQYPISHFDSPALNEIRRWGRIATTAGSVPLNAALGVSPEDPEALETLYRHPNSAEIKRSLDLADPVPRTLGEQVPVPLVDEWPGIVTHLAVGHVSVQLVRCDQILVAGRQRPCAYRAPDVLLASSEEDDEYSELQLVSRAIDLRLSGRQIIDVVDGTTAAEVEERRQAVRSCSSDAERLLAAVGVDVLRAHLPASLVNIVEQSYADPGMVSIAIAESAIATYHTGTLREFRAALKPLDPPKQCDSPWVLRRLNVLVFCCCVVGVGGSVGRFELVG